MSFWDESKVEVFEALELLDDVLEDYDEECGLAFSDVQESFDKLYSFMKRIYYPKSST